VGNSPSLGNLVAVQDLNPQLVTLSDLSNFVRSVISTAINERKENYSFSATLAIDDSTRESIVQHVQEGDGYAWM
jgi:hypothetical protein